MITFKPFIYDKQDCSNLFSLLEFHCSSIFSVAKKWFLILNTRSEIVLGQEFKVLDEVIKKNSMWLGECPI